MQDKSVETLNVGLIGPNHHYHISYIFNSADNITANYGSFQFHTSTTYLTAELMEYIYERIYEQVSSTIKDPTITILCVSYIGCCPHDLYFKKTFNRF